MPDPLGRGFNQVDIIMQKLSALLREDGHSKQQRYLIRKYLDKLRDYGDLNVKDRNIIRELIFKEED